MAPTARRMLEGRRFKEILRRRSRSPWIWQMFLSATSTPTQETSDDACQVPGPSKPMPWRSPTESASERMTRGFPVKRKYEPDFLQAARDMENIFEWTALEQARALSRARVRPDDRGRPSSTSRSGHPTSDLPPSLERWKLAPRRFRRPTWSRFCWSQGNWACQESEAARNGTRSGSRHTSDQTLKQTGEVVEIWWAEGGGV